MNILLILAIFWPALAGLAIFLTPSLKENKKLRGQTVSAALGIELLLTIVMCFGKGTQMVLLNMTPTLRIEMNVDVIGCIFSVLMSTMWLLSSVFAREYMGHDDNERLYQVFYMCVLSALIGQCYAGSMVTLYVFYELMTLLSVPMVVHERTPQAVAAGIKYLVYSIFGAMLGLLGIFFFSNYLGTVTFVPGGVETAASAPSGLLLITFLVIIGFGTKAGVLAVLRVIYYLVGADVLRGTWVQKGFMTLTLITVFMGSMLAYRETLLKKRLAYSTVSQVSYVLFGLACMVPAAFEGAILHVVAHSVIKDALFLCAGAIIHQTGKIYVRDLRGIGKEMPITTWCWTIASLGLIGIPPTGGFVSKWQLATGSLETGLAGFDVVGPIILIVSALLTAAYLLPVTINGFFPGSDYDYSTLTNKEGSKLMTVPMILLAAGVVLTGIFAQPLINVIMTAAASIL